jgi:hypothetical protein
VPGPSFPAHVEFPRTPQPRAPHASGPRPRRPRRACLAAAGLPRASAIPRAVIARCGKFPACRNSASPPFPGRHLYAPEHRPTGGQPPGEPRLNYCEILARRPGALSGPGESG